MSEKVIIDDKTYRITVFPKVRKTCDECHSARRRFVVSMRIYAPAEEKGDIAVCYECLLEKYLGIRKTKNLASKARERIKKKASEATLKALEKARAVKERKRNERIDGVSSQVLDSAEVPPSEAQEKNGCHRAGSGRAEDGIVYLSKVKETQEK